ncbi:hypothetical protein D3C86_2268800 [compost metagenome]
MTRGRFCMSFRGKEMKAAPMVPPTTIRKAVYCQRLERCPPSSVLARIMTPQPKTSPMMVASSMC